MLARWRSPSQLELPKGTGSHRTAPNAVLQFAEAYEWTEKWLKDAGFSIADLPLRLRLWDGPLAGIVHQEGQFAVLQEGPAGEGPAAVAHGLTEEQQQALSLDLEDLAVLAQAARPVLYSAMGSESEFALMPLLLEPVPAAASGTAAGGDAGVAESLGGRLGAALGRGVTAEEVIASVGISGQLAATFPKPVVLDSKEAFIRHMTAKHIWLADSDDEQEEAVAAALKELDINTDDSNGAATPADPNDIHAVLRCSKAAFARCCRKLVDMVSFPVVEVVLGSEDVGYNPIPVVWVGRSRRSGCIVGLTSAIVWT